MRVIVETARAVPKEIASATPPGVQDMALEMLPPPCKALNAGAGRGAVSWIMARCGYDVASVDVNPSHFAAQDSGPCTRANLSEGLGDFEDESFGCVVAVEVIEHLESPWVFFREALRVLQPGGLFVFTTPNVMSLPSRLSFLLSGELHYFRESSFTDFYHVTPIFRWSVKRACMTAPGELDAVRYSRTEWPFPDDEPRRERNTSWLRRKLLGAIPPSRLTGECAGYAIRKTGASTVTPGLCQK